MKEIIFSVNVLMLTALGLQAMEPKRIQLPMQQLILQPTEQKQTGKDLFKEIADNIQAQDWSKLREQNPTIIDDAISMIPWITDKHTLSHKENIITLASYILIRLAEIKPLSDQQFNSWAAKLNYIEQFINKSNWEYPFNYNKEIYGEIKYTHPITIYILGNHLDWHHFSIRIHYIIFNIQNEKRHVDEPPGWSTYPLALVNNNHLAVIEGNGTLVLQKALEAQYSSKKTQTLTSEEYAELIKTNALNKENRYLITVKPGSVVIIPRAWFLKFHLSDSEELKVLAADGWLSQ